MFSSITVTESFGALNPNDVPVGLVLVLIPILSGSSQEFASNLHGTISFIVPPREAGLFSWRQMISVYFAISASIWLAAPSKTDLTSASVSRIYSNSALRCFLKSVSKTILWKSRTRRSRASFLVIRNIGLLLSAGDKTSGTGKSYHV